MALRESGLAWKALRNAFHAEYQLPAGAQALATGRLVHNNWDGRTAYVSRGGVLPDEQSDQRAEPGTPLTANRPSSRGQELVEEPAC